MTEHVVDAHGWIKTDEKLPANLETVLIWHDEVEDVQVAEWQSQPRPPTDWLPLDTSDTGDVKP